MRKVPINRSVFLAWLVAVAAIASGFYCHAPWNRHIVFGGDCWGYYAYLPATFIHHDLDNLEETFAASARNGCAAPNLAATGLVHEVIPGKVVLKYSSGIAYMYAPFFGLAHAMARWWGFAPDGWSLPYLLLANISCLVYVFAGLWLLGKLLQRLFSPAIAALAILTLALATNLFFFTVSSPAMAHGYLFFWFCGLVYATHHFYEKKQWKHALVIGLSCGMITLSRPSEIFCVLIPLLYGISGSRGISERIEFLRQHARKVWSAAGLFLLPLLPQMIYWKWTSGKFLFYSYGNESFDFLHPHILGGLLDFKNGWFIYTPVMWLAVIGLIFLWKDKNWRLPVYAFLPPFIYVTYSWWCWNYINGFGSRPMIDVYPLLAIPFCYTMQWLLKQRAGKIALALLLLFFTGLNLFQTWQFKQGILWTEVASKAYYLSTFGKTGLDWNAMVAFDSHEMQPDSNHLLKIKNLHFNDFESPTDSNYVTDIVHGGKYAFLLSGKTEISPIYEVPLDESGIRPGDWIRISAWCRNEQKTSDWYRMNLLVARFRKGEKIQRERFLRIENKVASDVLNLWGGNTGKWGYLSFYAQVPTLNIRRSDNMQVFLRRATGNVPVYVDNLKVEAFREK